MRLFDRRQVASGLGALAGLAATGAGCPAYARSGPRVVIVGGGAGGATVASYLRRGAPDVTVTLIERNKEYTTCFFSSLCIAGLRSLDQLTHSYRALEASGVEVIHDVVVDVSSTKKVITLLGGSRVPFDRLVLSPGIEFDYRAIDGYSREAAEIMPHAWHGRAQMALLMNQLEAMPDGGVAVLVAPPEPYRCPPGPYERACMIAYFLKTKKPGAKLIVFDPKRSFSKQDAFLEAFQNHYPGIVEMHLSDEIDDYSVARVDPATKTVTTKSGASVAANVVNIIPPQRAGGIAYRAGCVEGDWCPVDPQTFASTKNPDIFVIGDAAVATDMPKSAFSANNHGKLVAGVLAHQLAGRELFPGRLRNTCWSLVAPVDSIKIGANYAVSEQGGRKHLAAFDGFVSGPGEDAAERQQNWEESVGWYSAIVADMLGTT